MARQDGIEPSFNWIIITLITAPVVGQNNTCIGGYHIAILSLPSLLQLIQINVKIFILPWNP